MADVLAVVGLAYPIAKDLFKLAKKLRRLYKQIRNAKKRSIQCDQKNDISGPNVRLLH